MDNPARTAEHLERVGQRHSALEKLLPELVGDAGTIVWEVGCGHGHFLTAYSAKHPASVCIGVDISADRVGRGTRKRDRAKLGNLHFVHADAWDFLRALPAAVTFDRIFILFPDPWPKRRHHKNRIMQPEFLAAIAQRAGRGTRLHFRTDHEEYFRAAEGTIRSQRDWQIVDETWPFEEMTVFQSRAPNHFSLTARRSADA